MNLSERLAALDALDEAEEAEPTAPPTEPVPTGDAPDPGGSAPGDPAATDQADPVQEPAPAPEEPAAAPAPAEEPAAPPAYAPLRGQLAPSLTTQADSPAGRGGRDEPVRRVSNNRAKPTRRDDEWSATKRKVRALVLEEMAPKMGGLQGDALQAEVRAALDRILQREDVSVSPIERRVFVSEMISDTLGYGPLDPLLRDDEISEIMCNAFDDIWVERTGLLEEAEVAFNDDAHYRKVIERIVSAVGRRIDESSPMVDARLPDGSRVNAVIPPLAIGGSVLTIRKFSADPLTAMDLVDKGTYTLDLVTVLEACVRGRLNILVSGGTGTGKTTNLNVMSSFIPGGERIITIEDSAELQLQQRHVVSLEGRPANAEGAGEVSIRDLVRNALRMRPDRIIIGECRAAETLDMLQAMNTGHEGSMTTIHANSARDALSRLETMVLMAGFDLPMRAIREQVAAAIDVILQVDRLPDGRRVVTSLSEVQGLEGEIVLLQDIFTFRRDSANPGGRLLPAGLRPSFTDRLAERGVHLPATVFRAPAEAEAPKSRSKLRAPTLGTVLEQNPEERA